MSTHVVGFKPATEDYKKKLAAYKACEDADVPAPQELSDYFDGVRADHIDPDGMEVAFKTLCVAVTTYRSEGRDGFDVDMTKLPPGVTRIRFFNSY